MSLSVLTASVDPTFTARYWRSWRAEASGEYEGVIVVNGMGELAAERMQKPEGFDVALWQPEVMGTVPAFAIGLEQCRGDVVACLHDDLEILEPGWDVQVQEFFDDHPRAGLACFSGADGLGAADIYRRPYEPHQLARVGFFSNMVDAEKHGRREVQVMRSACGDGFSQIGRLSFMHAAYQHFLDKGVVHHAFDSWLGALAQRAGWDVWFLPIRCHHAGGVTAVGSAAYAEWAAAHGGDHYFWEKSHRAMFEDCRSELPIRVR